MAYLADGARGLYKRILSGAVYNARRLSRGISAPGELVFEKAFFLIIPKATSKARKDLKNLFLSQPLSQ